MPGPGLKLAAASGRRYFAMMSCPRKEQDSQEIQSFDPERRRFLGGLAGAAWLAGTGGLVSGCSSANILRVPLAAAETELLRMLAPAILYGLLPMQPTERKDSLDS